MAACEQENPAHDKINDHIYKYFYRTNHINKTILLQEKIFKKHLDNQWENIPPERKDALLDLLFVDEEVREKYSRYKDDICTTEGCEESFPRLLINSGQKINVDFENELWTWRDEHSGPFSWMSRSQQDLTLDDLEPDNILKPQPKQVRIDLEDENSVKKAKSEFTHPCNSWCHEVVDDFKKHQSKIIVSPSPSMEFYANAKAGCSVEEVNPAFEGSVDDLSACSSPEKKGSRESSLEKEVDLEPINKSKNHGRKSPSPKKSIIRSNSFKKSPVKKSDRGKEEKLIMKGEESCVTEAYCNPVMESEWSNFVGDQFRTPITDAPEVQIIDRGERSLANISTHSSPYSGDQIKLIPGEDDSPEQPRTTAPSSLAMSPDYSDLSAESTPDHKTHLLKGLQSPVHLSYKTSALSTQTQSESPDNTTSFKGIQKEDTATAPSLGQTEELLTVVMDGGDIHVTSEEVKQRDSKIPSTGFDFLDNW
ncbi:chromosome 1 open reading frame 198 [Plakobranchus ocellatus]|uniref:Chromosome 1 open reading frame 198 n=1 Tax=Plakobranchus ocellatus TaxID=259542 RepID=A0AAV3ZRM3_9GAST|nr:chromosome 1 open reading frame 198 [Plakobranchus ocellatus]